MRQVSENVFGYVFRAHLNHVPWHSAFILLLLQLSLSLYVTAEILQKINMHCHSPSFTPFANRTTSTAAAHVMCDLSSLHLSITSHSLH